MRSKSKPSVVVVGAGPSGLAASVALNRRKIPVEVIDRDDRPGTHSYALALHHGTREILNEWGIAEVFETNGLRINKLVFCDHKEVRHTLDLKSIQGQEHGLLVVGQDHLESALIEPLEQAQVPLCWSRRLSGLEQTESGVNLELEQLVEGMSGYAMARLEWQVDKEISDNADYVIGADGHFSLVRRRLGIEFPKVAPTQSFAVFEFKTDYDHQDEARIVFGDEGTSVLWPLPGGYCRWGFEIGESKAEQYSRDKDRLFMQVGNQGYHVLESSMLSQLIEARAPWFNGSIGPFRWRMIVRFEKRLAEAFGAGRVWLAGDAGHLTGPVGMQSMNIGVREGNELGNLLADIVEGQRAPEMLEDYSRQRVEEWRQLMGLDLSLQATDRTDPFLAAHADRLLGCLPTSIDSLPAFAEALDFGIRGS